MNWDALQNPQVLHSKAHCSNHTENLALCLAKTCFKTSMKLGLKLISVQHNLKFQKINSEHKQLNQLVTQTMFEALT
jgi:hypothetical protein